MSDGPLHPKQRDDDATPVPPVTTKVRKFPVARFEASLSTARLAQKGEYHLELIVPWEDRERAKELLDYQGIVLDWRVTRKPE